MYIINYTNGNGFAVVSANKATEGLLAVTEKGTYNNEDSTGNIGFSDFMQKAKTYVSTATSNPSLAFSGVQYKAVTDTVSKSKISAKVSVQWGQAGIEGTYAANGIAGCSNVAMSQIMSYFCYPSTLSLTYDNADASTLTLDWDDIKLHKISHHYSSCSATDDAHTAIGKLHRQLGEINNSSYLTSSTSTYDINVKNSFSNLGYTVTALSNYNNYDFYSELSNNYLIYMRGDRQITDSNGDTYTVGHAWLVDGCYKYTTHSYEMTRAEGETWEIINDAGYASYKYVHINWGYDGNCNGLFSTGVFALNNGKKYDNSSMSNSTDAQYNLNLMYFCVTH